jgi:glutamate carboxypeptidase
LEPKALLAYCQAELRAMIRCLRRAVEIESPSRSKPHVDRMAEFVAHEFRRIHAQVRTLPHPTAGSAVVAEWWGAGRIGRGKKKPILLLGHLDTVWEAGTLKRMPFRVAKGRAYGPGVFDMKSGIVCGLWAVKALQAKKILPGSPVRFLLTPDEEISSLAFRHKIREEAQRARAVLVLEPAGAGGALKTARKGVGEFRLTVHGRAAHAGINPAAGVNAISELARQLLRIERFARPAQGLTVSAGVVEGGTRSNVVPERASAWIDVRIPRMRDREIIEWRMNHLKPYHPEARLEIEGGVNRPPLERKMTAELFRLARRLGDQMGLPLQETATGGGSDGNFTAALGVPTLDGLGGVGEGAHALDEHVILRELPRRAALVAALLAAL